MKTADFLKMLNVENEVSLQKCGVAAAAQAVCASV